MRDKIIRKLIEREARRQQKTTNLIASENFVSEDVLKALGSVFTNKYAEGYPGRRYYGGNEIVDELEELVKARALKLFKLSSRTWQVNVQPYSGSPANLAVYHALVPLGGKIMGLGLDMGGHLTHGHKVSVTGKLWQWVHYSLSPKTEQLDYPAISKLAKKEKPKLIVTGYTAYSRVIDFKKFRRIANTCGALLMVDMSHFAGLVAGEVYPVRSRPAEGTATAALGRPASNGVYPSPFPYADVIMTTTHKTLRGPRAALIFSRKEFSQSIDKTVFPGLQGGPHVNQIAAIGVALYEASRPSFKRYARQVVRNARMFARELQKLGWRIVSGGTDTHLFLVDTMARGIGGKQASEKLEKAGIIVNKNTIPFDKRSPVDPSGIRIGTPAVTSRGMKEKDMKKLAQKINNVLLK